MHDQKKIQWTFDPNHCNIRFVARHLFISEVEGAFQQFTGSVSTVGEDFTDADISLDIEAASLKTSSEIRDNNLRSDNFFNAALYPQIRFRSVSMKKTLGNKYLLTGELTIRNVTKTVQWEVEQNGFVTDADGKPKAGFKVRGSVNRFDYNINFNRVVNGAIDVGLEVEVVGNIELFKVVNT